MRAVKYDSTSVSLLGQQLVGKQIWFFCGHGAALQGQTVPVFQINGQLEAVSIDALVAVIRSVPTLKLVVLAGCCTEQLGRALRDAGVPDVVCWSTKVNCAAAAAFGKAFVEATAKQQLEGHLVPAAAFDTACAAVKHVTEDGALDGGRPAQVQMYALVDPDDKARVYPSKPPTSPRLMGRLRTDAGFPPGRLAAGKPVHLSAIPSADVPDPAEVAGGGALALAIASSGTEAASDDGVETLVAMFPTYDKDILSIILAGHSNNVGAATDQHSRWERPLRSAWARPSLPKLLPSDLHQEPPRLDARRLTLCAWPSTAWRRPSRVSDERVARAARRRRSPTRPRIRACARS